jgi:hypothetical protein
VVVRSPVTTEPCDAVTTDEVKSPWGLVAFVQGTRSHGDGTGRCTVVVTRWGSDLIAELHAQMRTEFEWTLAKTGFESALRELPVRGASGKSEIGAAYGDNFPQLVVSGRLEPMILEQDLRETVERYPASAERREQRCPIESADTNDVRNAQSIAGRLIHFEPQLVRTASSIPRRVAGLHARYGAANASSMPACIGFGW